VVNEAFIVEQLIFRLFRRYYCPNCGKEIQKKALRCKYCKTTMNELLLKAGAELQLHDLNPEDIEFVENILS